MITVLYVEKKSRPTIRSGTRAPYPQGSPHQLTEEWKLSVQAWLDENGKNRQWLAGEIPADPSTVKATLDPVADGGSATSKLVPRICELTGLPRPLIRAGEGWEERALEVLRLLGPNDREHVIETALRLRRGGKG